jgi:hypothetical protein
MTFEPGPANPQPHTITLFTPNNDPHEVLPPGAPQNKWTALHQRKVDGFAATPPFADVQELAHKKFQLQADIANKLKPKAEGGFGLSELAVVSERRALERAEAELVRLTGLKEDRGARANIVAQLERSITDWLFRGGIPSDCTFEAVEDAPLSELLKKGERIADAVERYRHRLRELAADLHRTRSAPWPSSVAKEKTKAKVEQWAEAAMPNLDNMIEHNSPLAFPSMTLSSFVRGTETPALAFTETTDTLGLFCWLFKDQLLAKINAGLDEAAVDQGALSQQQREQMEAQISSDMLTIERSEVACIWHAEAAGEVLDFCADTSPQSLLGVQLVRRPRANGSGTSAGHAFDIVMPGRR